MIWLALGFGAFAGAILIHGALAWRLGPGSALGRFLATGGLAAFALWGALRAFEPLLIKRLAALALYAGLCELYIFLFCFVMSSISAEILIRLRQDSPNEAAEDRDLTQLRLANLERKGFIRIDGGLPTATAKGRAFVLLFRGLRAFFRHEA